MKRLFVALALAILPIVAFAQATASITLVWTAPTTNVDGSALTDLASYEVYRGTSATNMVPYATISPPYSGYTDSRVATGTNYFYAVVAVDSAGVESPLSNTITVAAAHQPSAPTGLQVVP